MFWTGLKSNFVVELGQISRWFKFTHSCSTAIEVVTYATTDTRMFNVYCQSWFSVVIPTTINVQKGKVI
jgi:hypothetical protein